jgi:hypothetical protein
MPQRSPEESIPAASGITHYESSRLGRTRERVRAVRPRLAPELLLVVNEDLLWVSCLRSLNGFGNTTKDATVWRQAPSITAE